MKKILLLAMATLPLVISAQIKLGIVNSVEIFNAMPDKVEAEAVIKAASERLHAEYVVMQDDFNKKYADYQAVAADATTPESIKERRVQELQESDKKIQLFQETSITSLAKQRKELIAPIETKVQIAIEDVSVEEGLSIVFDTAKTPVAFANADVVDITAKVKKRLGLN